MTDNDKFYEDAGLRKPSEAELKERDRARALLVERIPALTDEVEQEYVEYQMVMGSHVTYGDNLPQYMVRLAEASPRDEAAIEQASAFLEEISADPELDNVAELSVISHILDKSPVASRLFIAERGGPHTLRLAESCAERFDVPLDALCDPSLPRWPEGGPIRSDPRWQRPGKSRH